MTNDMEKPLLSDVEPEENFREKLLKETKKIWIVAAPATFTRFTTFGVSVISLIFIGHIGPIELAAFSLVSTVILRFANGILLGMASALETLCGQAFGAKQYHMLGIYLQRSWIVLFGCSLLLMPIFILSEELLLLLGQEPEIASVSGTISQWFILIVFSYLFSFTLQMYLQAQSKNMIVAYLAALSISLHTFLSWLFSMKLNFGLTGVMGSMVLASWIPILGQLAFVFFGGCPDTWKGFSFEAFRHLWPVVKLSVSSGVMLCLELWYNTVLVLLTGHMKHAQIAIDALSICLNINGWELMISLGFFAATSVRVSNELGSGSAKGAMFSILIAVSISFLIGIILFIAFLLFRGNVAYVFTENQAVVDAVSDLSPLLAFSLLMNSVQPVISGVAVGAGWQSVVAYVNIACYYLIGIPTGVILGYVFDYHVKGIWMGMIFGTFVQTLVLIVITWKTDWDKQVAIARDRVSKWSLPKPEQSNKGVQIE